MSNVTKMPNTKTIELGNLTLQCRLDGMAILKIEKRLDESLMGLLLKGEGEMKIPPINKLLTVLHLSNTTHGVREDQLIKAYVKYIEDGGTTMDIFQKVNELMEESGFFGKSEDKQEDEEETVTLDNPTPEESEL